MKQNFNYSKVLYFFPGQLDIVSNVTEYDTMKEEEQVTMSFKEM